MGAWFIGAPDIQKVYECEEVMKAYPATCDDLGKDRWVAHLKGEGRWRDDVVCVKPLDEVFLDGGGMIHKDEPQIGWEANGCAFKTYVRHLPFELDFFKDLKPHPRLGDCVFFKAFLRWHIISIETIKASIETMERLQKGTESLRQELEINMQATINAAGGRAFSARKCGCMSGRAYGDCCGKHVEAPEAKNLRKAVEGGNP